MPAAHLAPEEIDRRGQEIYEHQLRPILDVPESVRKIVSIDVE